MLITEEQLKKIYPNASAQNISLYTKAFNDVWPAYNINTARRMAAFLGQIAVESGQLKYNKELPSKWNKKNPADPNEPVGTLYDGRKNLGNTQPGDGPRFLGRGILQLTGRANYTEMGRKLSIPLVSNPELACDPLVSTRIACQYFSDRDLLKHADVWNLDEITLRVNGKAKLHHKERVDFSEAALKVLTSQPAQQQK